MFCYFFDFVLSRDASGGWVGWLACVGCHTVRWVGRSVPYWVGWRAEIIVLVETLSRRPSHRTPANPLLIAYRYLGSVLAALEEGMPFRSTGKWT